MTMVQNVGSLLVLRAILKRKTDTEKWEEFLKLESHMEKRIGTSIWEFYENTVQVRVIVTCSKDEKNLYL